MHSAHAAHTAVVPGIHPKAPPHPNTVGMPLHMHQTSAHTTVAAVVHTTTQRHQDLHYGPVLKARHRHDGLPARISCCQSNDRRECADSLCQESGYTVAPRDSMSAHSFRDPATWETRRFMSSRMQYTAALQPPAPSWRIPLPRRPQRRGCRTAVVQRHGLRW